MGRTWSHKSLRQPRIDNVIAVVASERPGDTVWALQLSIRAATFCAMPKVVRLQDAGALMQGRGQSPEQPFGLLAALPSP